MTHALTAAEYKPYGDVQYADPGYQADKVKRYPLDSEAHCRAAWAYVNQADNAAKYTPAQLKRIKGRIKAAGAKYGIDFAESTPMMASRSLPGIELARAGTWNLKTGPITVTPGMLDDAARFAARENARPGYLKIGHTDPRFMAADGEPALGWLHNIRLEEDDQGDVLKGDLHDVPDWLAEAIPKHWPDRSIEGYADYTDADGQKYGLVVDGLALLGVTPPGMSSIRSLRDLPAALGVAASGPLEPSGTRIVASFGDPSPTPAPTKADGPPTTEGAGMSLAKYREALAGLPDDASEEDVRGALVTAGLAVAAPDSAPQSVSASAVPPGMMIVASSVWEQNQETMKKLNAFVDQTKRNERDEVIATAVRVGKLTPADKPHFSKLWDADPDAARAWIDNLTPNSRLAVMASGYAGESVEDTDAEFAHLFPPTAAVKEPSRG
jgi:hypothetical protein